MSISNAPHYSFFCLVTRHQYYFHTITHFSTISYPINSKASTGVLDKWMFEFLEAPVHSHSEYFWQPLSKTSMLESFLSTLGSFSKSCSEQLFCGESVCTCFCKKVFHSTLYLRNSWES